MTLDEMLYILDLPCDSATLSVWDFEEGEAKEVASFDLLTNIKTIRERLTFNHDEKFLRRDVVYVGYSPFDSKHISIELDK